MKNVNQKNHFVLPGFLDEKTVPEWNQQKLMIEMSEEERDAYQTCLQTNEIIFEYLLVSKDCRALARLARYINDKAAI